MSSTYEPETRLRADARRNRDQIIAAARMLFIDRGADVPMEEIARAAQVGVGTLYRRFPDRDELIRAVSLDSFNRLWEEAKQVRDEDIDAISALTRLLRLSQDLQLGVTMSMLSERALIVIRDEGELEKRRTELLAILDSVVHRAQAEGSIRADVDTGDVVLALTLVVRSGSKFVRGLWDTAAERMVALIMDGLRAPNPTPLPGRPISSAEIEQMRSARFQTSQEVPGC